MMNLNSNSKVSPSSGVTNTRASPQKDPLKSSVTPAPPPHPKPKPKPNSLINGPSQNSLRAQELLRSLTQPSETHSELFLPESKSKCKSVSSSNVENESDHGANAERNEDEDVNVNGANELESEAREYRAFLSKLERDECSDIVKSVRLFVTGLKLQHETAMAAASDRDQPLALSNGSESGSGSRSRIRSRSARNVNLESRIVSFLARMKAAVCAHPEWLRSEGKEVDAARQFVQKYVMVRVVSFCFAVDPKEIQEDSRISKKLRVLATFISADHLEVPQCCRNDMVLSLAQEELKRVNAYAAPWDKVLCIYRACTVLSNVLNLSLEGGGMDNFFPTFLFMLLGSNVAKLWCNLEYIRKFTDRADLVSRAGYCYTHLRSALYFYDNLKAEQIGMTTEEMDRLILQAEPTI